MYPTSNLQFGQSGSEVKKLQQFLISQGMQIPSGPTGYFGNETKTALTNWQKQTGVDAGADFGYWGPKSQAIASSNSNVNNLEAQGYREGDMVPGKGILLPDGTFKSPNAQVSPQNKVYTQTTIAPSISQNINNVVTPQDYTKQIESIIESIVSSGKAINPNLTIEDLAELDPAEFLRQAEIEVAPEYKGKFAQVKDELTRSLTNIGYDLTKTREQNQRVTEQNLEAGTEDLSGRGLAFSGQRNTFEKDTASALSRANESARELAFRSAQTSGTKAESLLGTSNLQDYSTPQVDGQRGFSFSSAPVLGSLVGEKQLVKENMAKQLELDERTRRAMASSNLSFA